MTGERIKNLRRERGLTQQQLADALGVERSSVGKYETGSLPSAEVMLRMAEYFAVSVDYLCEREEQGMVHAENEAERRLLVMFRKTEGISEARRDEITRYIGSTIDMYLKALEGGKDE
ncbi:MAG: helix-turn-helix transcriptional regulator [Clostridia bacterium]|nr:helix-turn-helix transcriptional regulator [Clostridia bacterium]